MNLRPWNLPRLGIVVRYVIVLTIFAVLPLAASIAVGSIASARLITHNVEQRLQAVADLQVAQARAVAATRGADARMSARLAEELAEIIEAEQQVAPLNLPYSPRRVGGLQVGSLAAMSPDSASGPDSHTQACIPVWAGR